MPGCQAKRGNSLSALCLFPAGDLVEMLMTTLAELLRQAARLDPAFDPASALAALDRSDGPTAGLWPSHGINDQAAGRCGG